MEVFLDTFNRVQGALLPAINNTVQALGEIWRHRIFPKAANPDSNHDTTTTFETLLEQFRCGERVALLGLEVEVSPRGEISDVGLSAWYPTRSNILETRHLRVGNPTAKQEPHTFSAPDDFDYGSIKFIDSHEINTAINTWISASSAHFQHICIISYDNRTLDLLKSNWVIHSSISTISLQDILAHKPNSLKNVSAFGVPNYQDFDMSNCGNRAHFLMQSFQICWASHLTGDLYVSHS